MKLDFDDLQLDYALQVPQQKDGDVSETTVVGVDYSSCVVSCL